MMKIAAKPNLLDDDKLNSKIERIFNNNFFQRIVESVDTNHKANSPIQKANQLIGKMPNLQNCQKVKKNEPKIAAVKQKEELPCFGGNSKSKKNEGSILLI